MQGSWVRSARWSSAWWFWPEGPARRSPPKERWRSRSSASSPRTNAWPAVRCRLCRRHRQRNAETIAAAAEALGAGEQGAQIALMVAYTESSLENLGPESGNDGSLGLFQQRVAAGWGTASEEQDPTDAAGMFVERLLTIPHWQSIAPWVAAQDVQHSAFNGVPSASNHGSSVVGGNYQANWTVAGTFLGAIAALADTVDCGGENGAEPAGPASSFGLPMGYAIPSDATPAETLSSPTPSPSWVTPMCGERRDRTDSTAVA